MFIAIMKLLKFDKDKVLNGAKVVTRNGKKVRHIKLGENRIMGDIDGVRRSWCWGGFYLTNMTPHEFDLFILDESEELAPEPVVDSHKADVIAAYCDGRLSMLKNSPFLSGEDYYNKKFGGEK